ncbi:hypothetical protein OPQ81_000838 [Rhizoctonia solani]|nr:hypothetical protein OPQ81_000838 [Rhizoctonia solani]
MASELISFVHRPRIDNGEDPVPITGPHNGTQISASERRVAVINSAMSASEIVTALGYYGCANLGHRLDLHSCGEHPMCNGGLGDIYKGEIGGLKVAIKTTRMYIMHDDEKYLKYAAKELYTWSKCKHPNVLSLLGVVEFRGQIGMVSEWMDNGDIRKYLGTRPGVDRCQLVQASFIFWGIIQAYPFLKCHHISDGLTYLHSVNINDFMIYIGIKAWDLRVIAIYFKANILISNNGTPMLTDFGNAVLQERSLQFTESTTRTNISPRWSAPEILAGYTSSSYAAGVYALGMEIITGKVPFHELRRDQALYHPIVNERKIPQRPNEHIPINSKEGNCFWSLLVNCWAYMPEERPSAAEAQILVRKITQRGLTYIPDPLF